MWEVAEPGWVTPEYPRTLIGREKQELTAVAKLDRFDGGQSAQSEPVEGFLEGSATKKDRRALERLKDGERQ